MPYIKQDRRAALDVIIDGLVKQLRRTSVDVTVYHALRFLLARGLMTELEPPLTLYAEISDIVLALVNRLHEIEACRGDLNYACTRVILEAMKPDAGWSYHSLK